jgi:hypothetical protein
VHAARGAAARSSPVAYARTGVAVDASGANEEAAMAEYERTTMVWVAPSAAFAYLADPLHLPDYVPVMAHAGSDADAGEAFLAAALGTTGEGTAMDTHFLADAGALRIEWGRPRADYAGSISVTEGVTDGTARLTIHLHTRDEAPRPETEQLLDQTMRNLLRRLSGR